MHPRKAVKKRFNAANPTVDPRGPMARTSTKQITAVHSKNAANRPSAM